MAAFPGSHLDTQHSPKAPALFRSTAIPRADGVES